MGKTMMTRMKNMQASIPTSNEKQGADVITKRLKLAVVPCVSRI